MIDGVKSELSFTVLHANRDYEKYHTWFQEDLREAGIMMNLRLVDWKNLEAELHNGRFDAVAMGWSGGDLEPDPKNIWHSSSIGAGSNFVGYRNPEVDNLIDEARMVTKREKRLQLFRKAYAMIASDVPYTPWFDITYEFYGVSSEILRPSDSLRYDIGYQTWSNKK
jgi:peptide/nickel transport system substrate-binding protein/microcin C transport system substrate-binding protein